MTEAIVARSAQIFTAFSIVMGDAGYSVLVDHARMGASMFVLDPVRTHVEPPLRRQPRYQDLLG